VSVRSLPALFRLPMARVGLGATVLLAGGQFAAYTCLRPLLETAPGVSADMITPMLLVYGVTGIAGTFLAEAAIRRSLTAALVGSALLLGSVLLLSPLVLIGPVGGFAHVAIWGTAFGAVPLCLQTWMMRAAPGAVEGGLALFISTFQVALAGGAALGGVAVDHLGVSSAATLGGSLAVAAGGLVLLRRHAGAARIQRPG